MAQVGKTPLWLILVIVSLILAALPEHVEQTAEGHIIEGRSTRGGAVYVRWGNDVCPESNDRLYTGWTGGSHYSISGGAANYLCLPSHPEFAPNQPSNPVGPSYIYGTEYEVRPGPVNDHESVCAVCKSPRRSIVMIPAANRCIPEWTLEYSGYLMSGSPLPGRPSSEYICVDSGFRSRYQPGVSNDNQAVLYYTAAKCGSLPCPPYEESKVLGCVVCSQ